jgi:hypothetical protein
LVQHRNSIEFVEFSSKKVLDTQMHIQLIDEIKFVSSDPSNMRILFVATENNLYMYDCDGVLQQQYN